jgi:antitoxin VapB
MAINIKNAEVEESIRRLAFTLGVDLTEAVGRAVTHELERSGGLAGARLARMRSIANGVAELPVRDLRTDDEILGYDDAGLPR